MANLATKDRYFPQGLMETKNGTKGSYSVVLM